MADKKPKLILPPTTVKVGYIDYSVKKENQAWGDKHNAVAEADTQNHSIHYVEKHYNQIELGNSILHELLHAVAAMHHINFNNDEQEEHVVDSFANGLTTVFKENPKFLNWLVTSIQGVDE